MVIYSILNLHVGCCKKCNPSEGRRRMTVHQVDVLSSGTMHMSTYISSSSCFHECECLYNILSSILCR